MRLHPRSLILAAALIAPAAAFTAGCGDSGTASRPAAAKPAASPPTLTSQLQDVVDAGAPGAIALVNDGHTVRLHAAGAAHPTDRFRAGSTTKSFVSTVALQLVGEGKLRLSDTVERWLPGILPYGDHVTVRQLLQLTSGVPDNQGPVEAEWLKGNMTKSWSPRELVALVADKKPDFAPGTSWAYSNTNYVLAGLVVERVTGHRLGDELQRRIFDPLHLRHTSFPTDESTIAGAHVNGYALVEGDLLDVTVLNPSGTWGAGNLVGSAPDIARFWRALLGGKLLAPAQLRAMKTTVPAWEGLRYGLGIMPYRTACGSIWGNGGDIAGYSNTFMNSEDGKHQAAVMADTNPAPERVDELRGGALHTAMSDALGRPGAC
ncbi:MAG TPA: serine hydrolase domain-containing protein [Solirubrobacteraceae bacterium]|jgi:D-alanyl-D-alanine carboxypeptidase